MATVKQKCKNKGIKSSHTCIHSASNFCIHFCKKYEHVNCIVWTPHKCYTFVAFYTRMELSCELRLTNGRTSWVYMAHIIGKIFLLKILWHTSQVYRQK